MALKIIDIIDPYSGQYRETRFEMSVEPIYAIHHEASYLSRRKYLLNKKPLKPMGLEKELIGEPSLFKQNG